MTQFHATLAELVALVEQWLSDDLVAVAMKRRPFRLTSIDGASVGPVMKDRSNDCVVFSEAPFAAAGDHYDFLERNPGALVLAVGRLGRAGLVECSLSTMSVSQRWKGIIAQLKRATHAGALAVDAKTRSRTGASDLRAHRYTDGAKALGDRGTPMLPIAGNAVYLLGERPRARRKSES